MSSKGYNIFRHWKVRLHLTFISVRPSIISLTAVFIAVVLMAGCALGPDFQRPSTPKVDRYTPQPLPAQTVSIEVKGGEVQRFIKGMDIPGQWWTLFHSKLLNDLIEQALKANPDLEAAQAALRVAWENVYAQQGAFFPSIDGNFNTTRQSIPNALSSPLADGSTTFSLHTAQVTVSYVPDVFGGTRRQVESLKAQADFQRFQLEATYLTLTSNAVAAAIQEAALRGQIAATKRIIDIQRQTLELLNTQYEWGQIASGDIAAQAAALAQVQATLPPLEKQLAQQRDLLARLAGRFPSETIAGEFDLSSLQLPQDLPVSLPSNLVVQRPDVRAAEEQLHSASAEIGVAIVNRLPSITLSANAGLQRHRNQSVVYFRHRILDIGRKSDSTDLPGGNAAAPATCRRSGLRPGCGAISERRAHRFPERGRHTACYSIRRRCPESGSSCGTRCRQEPCYRAYSVGSGPNQLFGTA